MSNSLRIKKRLSIDSVRQKFTAQSQPCSPRGSKIQKKISNLTHNEDGNPLWNPSSMAMVYIPLLQTRDISPNHKIPNSIRFKSIEEDSLKNTQFLAFELRKDIKTTEGKRFAKSTRPEHFVKGLGEHGPSPASYKCSRFL